MAANTLAKYLGFSLVELLVSMTISALLLLVALPLMNSTLDKLQLEWKVDKVSSSIKTAKLEVLKTASSSVLCRLSENNRSCAGNVFKGVSDWSNGWLVFSDVDKNKSYDELVDKLQRVVVLSRTNCLITSNRGDSLSFHRLNLLQSASAASIQIKCGKAQASLIINWLGRVRIEKT